VGGEALVQAAAKLGIAISTARTQLQQVFAKTRTSRQAELIRIFLDTTLPIGVERSAKDG
jgi:DNA-binding CsgD family transcriptional regulator